MKKPILMHVISVLILFFSLSLSTACSEDKGDITEAQKDQTLSEENQAALLFMLEEEKLARDTYIFLNNMWSINQFANIQKSEQTHMNAIENLLFENNIEHTIKSVGEFKNQTLQNLYNQFEIDGTVSKANAMQIGATIEDLDIKDLQDYLDRTTHLDLIAVFENLQCGSRNHLRSFVSGIENGGNTYTPQFITQEDYNAIISTSQEKCN